MPKLQVVNIASEVAPFAKVGGLADVVGSLPIELRNEGIDARVVAPSYEQIQLKRLAARRLRTISVPFAGKSHPVTIYTTFIPRTRVPVYLLEESRLLSRGPIYGRGAVWRDKMTRRFLFLNKATFVALETLGFKPDVLHLHDWPTAPAAIILQQNLAGPFFSGTKSLVTLHNIHNQNRTNAAALEDAGINPKLFSQLSTENSWGVTEYNMLGQSILSADAVNTVSPRYAKEIYEHFFSEGLERILKKRKDKVTGILNGIDTAYFNPMRDKYIAENYSMSSLLRKVKNKTTLQKRLGLEENEHAFMSGMVTRLVPQKGIELLLDATKQLSKDGYQFVILGDGDDLYERQLANLQKHNSKSVAFVDHYDSHLANLIYAGADAFLMPSRYEPCGLTQMIAMRYGTVPIVHDTGGLHDSVRPYPKKSATGFVFKQFDPNIFIESLIQAKKTFSNKKAWHALQEQGMKEDFSWKVSAREYVKLYKKLV